MAKASVSVYFCYK